VLPLKFHPAARLEWLDAKHYYAERSNTAAATFDRSLSAALDMISAHPLAGAPLSGSVRSWSLARVEYHVIYRTNSEFVFVLAVAHDKRRPGYWRERLR
jgi:toxin ParE1/3/4